MTVCRWSTAACTDPRCEPDMRLNQKTSVAWSLNVGGLFVRSVREWSVVTHQEILVVENGKVWEIRALG